LASTDLQPRVILDDAAVIAVDKPAGWIVHDEPGRRAVLAWVQQREAERGGDPEAVKPVHRLDKDTSGVLLFARGEAHAAKLGEAFRVHQVLKVYIALVSPLPPARWQEVHQALRPKRVGGGEFMEVVAGDGLQADSEVEVLARGRQLGLVRVIPEQGRKHQVRVALASLGAPIAGDFLYGGALSKRLAPRVMLHARALELAHPLTGKHLRLVASLPADLLDLVQRDGGSVPGDLDRRHRSEPERRRHDATRPHPQQTRRAELVQPPRGTRKSGAGKSGAGRRR
jgi:23S rRNA pseudouridine1911/1915/1917 synthase